MTHDVVRRGALALGSNVGDRLGHLQAAVRSLAEVPGLAVAAVSPVYQTAPVGGPDQPDYLNAVVVVSTRLRPRELLAAAHRSERMAGRVRLERWGPRTLDVDVLALGEVTVGSPDLVVPHPRLAERAFVLAPWSDVDPEFEVPGAGPVGELAAALSRSGVERVDGALELPPAEA